jgi:hypothetical protein
MSATDNTPRIAFVTTCRGRTAHLRQTLPKNIADNKTYRNCVFVVLIYATGTEAQSYLKAHHANDILSGRLVVYSFADGGIPFHMALSKNIAARCGILEGADILCTLDADNFTGENFAQFIAQSFREPGIVPGIFMCPNYQLIKSLPHGALRPARGYAGRLVLWAQTFLKMGGYDEIYDCWGSEDMDLNFRLLRAGYAMRYIENGFLHAINHSAAVRFKEYPHAQQYENASQVDIIRARTETVVNYGRFGLGTVYRNFNPDPIEFKPLPTRVFGIGLHKTGTTSLNEAFKKLGLDSFHWGKGETPLIWYEMNALGRSKTLEQWYALSDNPIPLFYKQLDKAYPGSKFILTVRDEVDWLQSVKKLWDYKYNPTRHLWDIYPISNQLHTALYGQKDFDALVFLERYRRHNAEVREYFKDRPNDLLVMDIDAGWSDLCTFLGSPVPNVPYPYMNRSISEIGMTT